MPAYLVTLDRSKSGRSCVGNTDAMVVFAADATAAKQACQAKFAGDGNVWVTADATATAIVAATDWLGWTFKVRVLGGITGYTPDGSAEVSLTATGAAQDTIDEIGTALAVLLNALPVIANAAFDTTTQVLTVAGTADNIGNQKIEVDIIPPGGQTSVAALVGTITHNGAANAALTVVLPADAAVIPSVPVALVQV